MIMGIHRLTPEEARERGFYNDDYDQQKMFSKYGVSTDEELIEKLLEEGKRQEEEEAEEDVEAHARDLGRRMLASGWTDNKPHRSRRKK